MSIGINYYPYQKGWEKKSKAITLVLLAQLVGLGLGAIRVLEDALHALSITKPTLHALFTSLALFLFFMPLLIKRHGLKNVSYMARTRSWLFLVYVAFDLLAYQSFAFARGTGSFLVFSAFQSALGLLVGTASFLLFKARFELVHYLGAGLAIIGVSLVLGGNEFIGRNYLTGAPFSCLSYILLGTTLSSLCYLLLEAGLQQFFLEEFLAFFGLFGALSYLLQMGFINPWEYAEVPWAPLAINFFALAVVLRAVVTLAIFYLVKLSTATFAAHATLSTEFFYILVRSFHISDAMVPYPILVYHAIGYLILLAGQILLALRVISQEQDMTHVVDFYQRPDLRAIANGLPSRMHTEASLNSSKLSKHLMEGRHIG